MKKTLLAIDQGTSNSRAVIFNQDGHVIAKAQQKIACYYPQHGWVEQNVEKIGNQLTL